MSTIEGSLLSTGSALRLPVPPTARGQFSTPSISALKNQGQKMSTIERATFLDRVCLRVCRCTPDDRVCLRVCRCTPYSTRVTFSGTISTGSALEAPGAPLLHEGSFRPINFRPQK